MRHADRDRRQPVPLTRPAAHLLQRLVSIANSTGDPERLDGHGRPAAREIVSSLEVDPILGRGAQRLGQQPGSRGSHTSLAAHQLADPLDRHAEERRQGHLRHAQRGESGGGRSQAGLAAHPHSVDQLWAVDLFRVTAARTSVLNASSSIFSPSWKSMARLVFPSRLALKRPEGSFRAAPLAKVVFTTFL